MPSILITGASSGIGRATAEKFLAEGWSVGAMARRADALAEVKGAKALVGDVTSEQDVARVFGDFDAAFGRLDVLFNNAGIFTPPGDPSEVALFDWRASIDVNLTGAFLCTAEAFRRMKAYKPQGGRIINNGSISATTPRPGSVAYTASKHAITGLTKSTALDGRPFDIACGQIDIGNAATEMVMNLSRTSGTTNETMDVKHAADAVFHMANLPLSANVLNMTVMATQMPFVGRG